MTSRYRLGVLLAHGAHGVHVDRLDTNAGIALLSDILGDQRVGREPEAAEELVALCTGLPLALIVAAGRLAARPSWPLGEMVAALSEEQRRLAELAIGDDMAVRSALDLSYQGLGADAARLYRLLGLVPGETFGGDAAAALGGIPAVEARSLLSALTDANLVTDTTGGRSASTTPSSACTHGRWARPKTPASYGDRPWGDSSAGTSTRPRGPSGDCGRTAASCRATPNRRPSSRRTSVAPKTHSAGWRPNALTSRPRSRPRTSEAGRRPPGSSRMPCGRSISTGDTTPNESRWRRPDSRPPATVTISTWKRRCSTGSASACMGSARGGGCRVLRGSPSAVETPWRARPGSRLPAKAGHGQRGDGRPGRGDQRLSVLLRDLS